MDPAKLRPSKGGLWINDPGHPHLPLDAFLYLKDYTWYVGTLGARGGKPLPPAANAALNASPGVKARRARHDFHPARLAAVIGQVCWG